MPVKLAFDFDEGIEEYIDWPGLISWGLAVFDVFEGDLGKADLGRTEPRLFFLNTS